MRSFAGFISAAALVFTVACAQTDAGITSAVKTKLAADDTVKAYQVDVFTSPFRVTTWLLVSTST
jgi:urea transporter